MQLRGWRVGSGFLCTPCFSTACSWRSTAVRLLVVLAVAFPLGSSREAYPQTLDPVDYISPVTTLKWVTPMAKVAISSPGGILDAAFHRSMARRALEEFSRFSANRTLMEQVCDNNQCKLASGGSFDLADLNDAFFTSLPRPRPRTRLPSDSAHVPVPAVDIKGSSVPRGRLYSKTSLSSPFLRG